MVPFIIQYKMVATTEHVDENLKCDDFILTNLSFGISTVEDTKSN